MTDPVRPTDPSDPRALRPGRVVDMQVEDRTITVLLETHGHDVPVTVDLDDASCHALAHVAALHGHGHECARDLGQDVQVGLLLRVLRAAGCARPWLIVRTGPAPAFWLHSPGIPGIIDHHLGPLDALVLLMSRRLPVAVDQRGPGSWEATFDRLLDGS